MADRLEVVLSPREISIRSSAKGKPLRMNHKDQKSDEAQVFEAFLQACPSLKVSTTSWEQPEKEPPDILCHTSEGRMRNFELTRWLHQKQIEKSKPRIVLEHKILSAIGDQGENPARNICLVMLKLKEEVRGLGRQDPKGLEEMRKLKEEVHLLISEIDRLWPKHREWHTPRGYHCKELDQYPTLKKYFSYVYFDPIQIGTEVREKPLGDWIMFYPPGGFYSPNDAREALRQTVRNKLEEYKDRKDIPPELDLIISYGGEAVLYNTPFQDVDVWTFADAAKIAAKIVAAELQKIQHPFKHVYLLKALYPKPEAFCIYPRYQECR
jgi:hypothetical protein